jgi:fused signal recognition particle receptor
MGLFDTLSKFKKGLAKTRESFAGRVQKLIAAQSKIDDATYTELERILLEADIGFDTTSEILSRLRQRVKEEHYENTSDLFAILKAVLLEILGVQTVPAMPVAAIPAPAMSAPAMSVPAVPPAAMPSQDDRTLVLVPPVEQKPFVIMVVGVNGAGKTTTIGKIAYQYRQAGYRVVIGAADTFRAAANEQLEIWAQRAGVEVVQQSHGSDPAAVAFDALSSACAKNADIVIIDTAGRLHTKVPLMEELRKIKRVLEKRLPGAPHEVLLVLDAATGQNGLQQAKVFSAAVKLTGLVLTKLDGTAKGGIVLAVAHEMKIPVKFIGLGEGIDDVRLFDPRTFVEALFAPDRQPE